MSEQLKKINNGSCLTREEMLEYLNGAMGGSRLRKVEEHLADCEFCSDAMEGLKLLTQEEQVESLQKLDDALIQKLQKRSPIFIAIRRAASIAAILLVTIGFAFYLNQLVSDKTNQVAMNALDKKKEEKNIQMQSKMDTVFTETSSSLPPIENLSGENSADGKKNISIVTSKDEESKKTPDANSTAVSGGTTDYFTFDNKYIPPSVDDEKNLNNDYRSDGDKIVDDQNGNNLVREEDISVFNNEALSGSVQSTSPNNSYIQLSPQSTLNLETITTKKYKGGKEKDVSSAEKYNTEEVPTTANDSLSIVDLPSDLFNQAMQYKSLAENQKAIDELDKLIKLNNYMKPQAMWEKANLLILMNKKTQAKQMLKELSEIDSPYKQQAIDKLLEF